MAINKDPGDTRTYTADKLHNFYMRASANPHALPDVSGDAHKNWAGRIAGIGVPHIAVAFYSCTFYSAGLTAATIQTSNDSSSNFVTVTNGIAMSTSIDHQQIPGNFMAPFSVAGENDGTVYYKILHSTDNSGNQTLTADNT